MVGIKDWLGGIHVSLNELLGDMVGVPYVFKGRDPKNGIDCYGLVMEAAKRLGYYFPEYDDPALISDITSGSEAEGDAAAEYKAFPMTFKSDELFVKIDKPEPGCLALFCVIPPYVTHIGVVLDDCNQFIHSASKNKNVCIEKLNSISWRHRIKGFYKWTKRLD